MVTMKIKRRMKDSSGQNDVNVDGVESNLNVHFFGGQCNGLSNCAYFGPQIPVPMRKKNMFG